MAEDLRIEDPTMTTDTPTTEDHHPTREDRPTANHKTDTTPMAPGGRHRMQEDLPTADPQTTTTLATPGITLFRAWKTGSAGSGKGTIDLAGISVGIRVATPTTPPTDPPTLRQLP